MAWTPIDLNVPQYVDSNGDPYSGAVLKAYAAGTTTVVNLATDSAGATTASSIALNANGFPEVSANVVIPHIDQDFKLALYPTQAAADANSGAIWTVDAISIGQVTTEWVDSGVTPTFVSTTSFTLTGDQTDEFHVGRRLRLTDSGGTDYASVTATAFTSLTTVTVSVDGGGVLDSGLSSVDLSILSADNSAMPHLSSSASGLNATGSLTVGGALVLAKGADVVAATDLLIGIAGNSFDVTGNTQINTLATKGIGTHVTLRFDGTPVLQHDATNLALPGGDDITAAVGDIAVFYEYGSATWRCVSYTKASGAPVVSGTPTGAMMPFAGVEASLPSGWLLCYGQAVSQTTYAALYALLGTTYGSDAGGNFTLPDTRGTVIASPDDMGGTGAGNISGTSLDGEGSTVGDHNGSFGTHANIIQGNGQSFYTVFANGVVQPTIGINWMIKT